ncbi:hypothetical protein KP509_21G019900 [Ceratopteris richardii]|uniref:Integrase zinc-binding domain-containing protein n=1 Tax=Ceratopteris richardii TaxID=49495 RepID=A0A8T2SA04_CERRI|nr:hypothetical protein KP509_21G019900 [Ceratopteris richardii]
MSFTVLENSLLQDMKEAQLEDPQLLQIIRAISDDSIIGDEAVLVISSPSKANKSSPYCNFSKENGILRRKGKVCIPNSWDLRRIVMHDNHDVPCARHPSVGKTIQLVRRTFWWLGLARDVHIYIQQCTRSFTMTGISPFEMNYGMNPTPRSTIGMPKKFPSALEFLANLQANLEIAKAKMQQGADRAKEYADRKRSPRVFEEGDRVFLQVPGRYTSLSIGKCTKLLPRFCGPWKIVKKLDDVAYRLELPRDCEVHSMFHVSKLRKYISREDNLIEGIVSLQESDSTYHSPCRILDWR